MSGMGTSGGYQIGDTQTMMAVAVEDPSAREPGRILVIDDLPAIHEDFRKIFAVETDRDDLDLAEAALFGDAPPIAVDEEFSLDFARQGAEGLACLQAALAKGRPYAVAFVDGRMPPGWDGVETITRLWQADPCLQVVLCTAYTDYTWSELKTRLARSDSLLILRKPFDALEVKQLALALTHKWKLARQARMRMEQLEAMVERRTMQLRTAHAELQRRVDTELTIAARIQTSLLPHICRVPGMEFAYDMVPTVEVGGDYYDVIPTSTGAWIGIGDVAGHGLIAGLIMLMVQSAMAGVLAGNPAITPIAAVVALNRVLFENIRNRLSRDEHVTFSLLNYDRSGAIRMAGAHEEAIVYRARDGSCELFSVKGSWLGARADIESVTFETRLQLEPGDVLVLYTDGLIEARNVHREEFGIDRVCATVKALGREAVEVICAGIHSAVAAWSPHPEDDLSLLIGRYLGTPTEPLT